MNYFYCRLFIFTVFDIVCILSVTVFPYIYLHFNAKKMMIGIFMINYELIRLGEVDSSMKEAQQLLIKQNNQVSFLFVHEYQLITV